jgi:hypothetical protein
MVPKNLVFLELIFQKISRIVQAIQQLEFVRSHKPCEQIDQTNIEGDHNEKMNAKQRVKFSS